MQGTNSLMVTRVQVLIDRRLSYELLLQSKTEKKIEGERLAREREFRPASVGLRGHRPRRDRPQRRDAAAVVVRHADFPAVTEFESPVLRRIYASDNE